MSRLCEPFGRSGGFTRYAPFGEPSRYLGVIDQTTGLYIGFRPGIGRSFRFGIGALEYAAFRLQWGS